MKKIVLLVLIIILLGCTKIEEPDLKKLMAETSHIILDVRTNAEYNYEHVVGAINIPVDEITEDINLDKEKLIFVYCKSGNRSKIAYDKLKSLGYNVFDLGAFSSIDLEKE